MQLMARVKIQGKILEGQGPVVVSRALDGCMHEATLYLEGKVKENTPTGVYGAQGGLLATVHGEVMGKGTPAVKGIVATHSPYGEVIEKGRRPNKTMPPPGVLLSWIALKIGAEGKEAERIEYLIRRKIGKKGFPGVHMFQRSFDEGWPVLQRIFGQAGFAITKELSK